MTRDKLIRFIQVTGACMVIGYCAFRLWNDYNLPSHDIVSQTQPKNSASMERWQEECVFVLFIGLSVALLLYSFRKDRMSDDTR